MTCDDAPGETEALDSDHHFKSKGIPATVSRMSSYKPNEDKRGEHRVPRDVQAGRLITRQKMSDMSSVQHEADPWAHEGWDTVFEVWFTALRASKNRDPSRVDFWRD